MNMGVSLATAACAFLISCSVAAQEANEAARQARVRPLANDFVTVYESPNPKDVYCYSPGIVRCASGRLVATMDVGGKGVPKLPENKDRKKPHRGKVFTSDDHGKTWTHRLDFPFLHARPFVAGGSLYVLGHSGDLMIVRSDDEGETWSEPVELTDKQSWHQAPCNVWHANGKVYLVMERRMDPKFLGWAVSVLAPVVMAGKVTDDLTRREAWTFSNELSFRDVIEECGEPNLIGVPFYNTGPTVLKLIGDRRYMHPIGWLETNIVQFSDPDHIWFDPSGRTFHLFMRAHTGTTNLACMAKAVEAGDGSITVTVEKAPSGKAMLFVPMPGGQMKFHILYDEKMRLFWLLSSQSTDSLTRPDRLPDDRFNLPNNERHRLTLHFSTNCMDWRFAGIVAISGGAGQGRHYASMVIDSDDLHILSRSGDERAKNAHDGNLITFHTVRNFRALVY